MLFRAPRQVIDRADLSMVRTIQVRPKDRRELHRQAGLAGDAIAAITAGTTGDKLAWLTSSTARSPLFSAARRPIAGRGQAPDKPPVVAFLNSASAAPTLRSRAPTR